LLGQAGKSLHKGGWTFREHDRAPGAASQLDVEARTPVVTHTVGVAKVQAWLASSAKSPSDKIMKDRLKGLLAPDGY